MRASVFNRDMKNEDEIFGKEDVANPEKWDLTIRYVGFCRTVESALEAMFRYYKRRLEFHRLYMTDKEDRKYKTIFSNCVIALDGLSKRDEYSAQCCKKGREGKTGDQMHLDAMRTIRMLMLWENAIHNHEERILQIESYLKLLCHESEPVFPFEIVDVFRDPVQPQKKEENEE